MLKISKRKRGPVRLPSDNLTEKEIEALHGEVKTYRLREPMTWEQFKAMPDDLKVEYIEKIRKNFNAPDAYIAELMFNITGTYFGQCISKIGLKRNNHDRDWDATGFLAWLNMVAVDVNTDKTTPDEPIEDFDEFTEMTSDNTGCECDLAEDCEKKRIHDAGPIAFAGNSIPVIPETGHMIFNNNRADDILKTLKVILGNTKVNVNISWNIVEEGETYEDSCCSRHAE